MGHHVFSCRSLLLSTIILNDSEGKYFANAILTRNIACTWPSKLVPNI